LISSYRFYTSGDVRFSKYLYVDKNIVGGGTINLIIKLKGEQENVSKSNKESAGSGYVFVTRAGDFGDPVIWGD
jgi:hypothetical protein